MVCARSWQFSFSAKFLQIVVVELVSERDRSPVPGIPLIGLVAAEQQDCGAPRIEDENNSHVPSRWTKLLHVSMSRSLDSVNQGTTERWTIPLQSIDGRLNRCLIRQGERVPPLLELVG